MNAVLNGSGRGVNPSGSGSGRGANPSGSNTEEGGVDTQNGSGRGANGDPITNSSQ